MSYLFRKTNTPRWERYGEVRRTFPDNPNMDPAVACGYAPKSATANRWVIGRGNYTMCGVCRYERTHKDHCHLMETCDGCHSVEHPCLTRQRMDATSDGYPALAPLVDPQP